MTGMFRKIWDLFESGNVVPVCAWCGRIRLDDSWEWAPTGAMTAIEPLSVTHSICPSCVTGQARIAELRTGD